MRGLRGCWVVALATVVGLPLVAPAKGASAEAAPAQVVINELHYHPPADDQEFLELHNPGGLPFDLTGACFSAGIGGCFADGTILAAGAFLLVAGNPSAVAAAFPSAPAVVLANTGSLSNGGERVTLSLGATTIDTVEYDDAAPWPLAPDGSGPSLELIDPAADNASPVAWAASDPAPTPGAVNTRFGTGPPPEVGDLEVGAVAADQPVAVAVNASGATAVGVEVTVGFAAPTTVPLVDDGAHGDGAAGDGRFGGAIPAQPAGTLVRYRVVAASASGSASLPASGAPRRLLGYVVARPPVATPLPVLDWYVAPADYQHLLDHPQSNDYVPAVVAAGGEVWDGAQVRVQGNSRVGPKYSFKFKMPKGSPLDAPFVGPPVDEFVIDGDARDSTGFVAPLALSVYADGNPLVPQIAKVRVEQNGEFFGLFTFFEELDQGWRQRVGLDGPGDEQYDPEGNVGTLQDDGSAAATEPHFEKVAPDGSDRSHLYELVQAIDGAPTEAQAARLRDLFDVPALVEFLAVNAIVQHWDSTVHNFMLVRDGATGRWRFVPADLDYTFGQPLSGKTNPVWLKVPGFLPFGPDTLVSALRADPVFNELYLRRVRTLADGYLASGDLQARADVLAPVVAADHALDAAKWGADQTQAQGLAKLAAYLQYRTADLLTTHAGADQVPAPTPAGTPITVRAATYAAPEGPSLDSVTLGNPSSAAIDVSGWRLEVAGRATLPAGSVIPAGGSLVVPGDPLAGAASRPTGTLLAGQLETGLDDSGGLLKVLDADGAIRAEAVLAELPVPPGMTPGLRIDVAADQVEIGPGDGSGVGLTVAVTNPGATLRGGVQVSSDGTTCARAIGSLAPGQAITYRCASTATPSAGPDRTYRMFATSGGLTVASPPVRVRTLALRTEVFWQRLPAAPGVPTVLLADGGRLRAEVALPAVTENAPIRWTVATGMEPGRARATQGQVVAPGPLADLDAFAVGRPVQVALAARNAAGTGARSVPTPLLTPRPATIWPFATSADLVRQVFRTLDGREPTAAELAAAVAAIDAGGSPAALVAQRLAAPRWSVTLTPMVRLYAAYFRRPPDPTGLAYWSSRRSTGASLDSISASFAATSEFRRTYGSLDAKAFVTLVYRNVLGRAPDAAGLSYWTRQLAAGRSRGRVMTAFSESAEGRSKLAPLVDPSVASVALLGAPLSPNPAESARAWLAGGGSLLTVIDGLRSSDAFAATID